PGMGDASRRRARTLRGGRAAALPPREMPELPGRPGTPSGTGGGTAPLLRGAAGSLDRRGRGEDPAGDPELRGSGVSPARRRSEGGGCGGRPRDGRGARLVDPQPASDDDEARRPSGPGG